MAKIKTGLKERQGEKVPIRIVNRNIKNSRKFVFKSVSISILSGLIAAGIFSFGLYALATPPGSPYNPGEILNPSCAPGDTNCSVVPPASYSFSSNNFSGTGDFNTTGGTITASTFKVGSIYTLPTADGTNGQALTTNGSGVVSWSTVSSLPSQTGNSGKYLTTDGTTASWNTIDLSAYSTKAAADLLYKPIGYTPDLSAYSTTLQANGLYAPISVTQYTNAMAVAAVGTPWTGLGYLTSSSTLDATKLSGALPALDGSSLTGVLHSFTETDPLSLHLDQTTPQTMSGGAFAGSGLLKITSGLLGVDTSTYLTSLSGALLATGATTGATSGFQKFNTGIGILEGGSTPTKFTYLQGGDQSVDLTYTLPTAYPVSVPQVLQSDTSGVMSWITPASTSPRVTPISSSSTPTPNASTTDFYDVTALAVGATFGAPTGSPSDGQKLEIRILDNGVAQTLAFNSAYNAGADLPLPTTTVAGKIMYLGFQYRTAQSKWDFVAFINNITP